MGEIENREDTINAILVQAYKLFVVGAFPKAISVIEEALSINFEHKEVVSALKCANFWNERVKRLDIIKGDLEKGEYLLNQWKTFAIFLERVKDVFEQCIYAVRQFVFEQALLHYRNVLEETGSPDAEILFQLGRCYKGKGDYERALEFLEASNHQKMDDPEILAELADCYALINEIKASKIFFREAFFINPQRIDITSLESLFIQRLIDNLKKMGFSSPELEEWIPVYGVIWGVFNIKRELKPLEYGKLKQSIYSMEMEIEEKAEKSPFLIPRLLNRYFRLIDHYIATKDERSRIDEVLMKIKKIDSSLYAKYIN
ncbi:MAG: tetratricopeptide repeat protein [Spirochaetota bacterium]